MSVLDLWAAAQADMSALGRGLPAVKMAQLRAYARLRDLLAAENQEERGVQR